jgi:thymidine phosphorylase
LLQSKAAWNKFKEIIKVQGGEIEEKKLKLADYKWEVKAKKNGRVTEIDNKKMNALARAAGCPTDKSAGLYLFKHCNERVKKGEKVLTIFSETLERLRYARKMIKKLKPILIE